MLALDVMMRYCEAKPSTTLNWASANVKQKWAGGMKRSCLMGQCDSRSGCVLMAAVAATPSITATVEQKTSSFAGV